MQNVGERLRLPDGRFVRLDADGRYSVVPVYARHYGGENWRPVPDDYAAGRRVCLVQMLSHGLGDHLQALPALLGLAAITPGTELVFGVRWPDRADWLQLFDHGLTLAFGCIETADPNRPKIAELPCASSLTLGGIDDYRRQAEAGTAGGRLAWYCRELGVEWPVFPTLRPLPEVARAYAWPHRGAVILCPHAVIMDRRWPVAYWHTLERLLLERQFPVVVLDNESRPWHAGFRSPVVTGRSPAEVAAIVRTAALLVSGDSGMAHLAGLIGTPALVLSGSIPGERVHGCYRWSRWIDGPLPCAGCHRRGPLHDAMGDECDRLCAALAAILPDTVVREVERMTCRAAWDASMLGPGPREALRRAVRETIDLPGELAELGVCQGGTARLMAETAPTKIIHLFDTWQGMPADDPDPAGDTRKGMHAAQAATAAHVLAGCRAVMHQGVFPETGAAINGQRFACVHIDMDQEPQTRDAIAFFWPRLSLGGRLVFDDWKRATCPGIERAVRAAFEPGQIEETAEYQCQITKR